MPCLVKRRKRSGNDQDTGNNIRRSGIVSELVQVDTFSRLFWIPGFRHRSTLKDTGKECCTIVSSDEQRCGRGDCSCYPEETRIVTFEQIVVSVTD